MVKITNKYNLPDPVYQALTRDDYSRGDSDISVTQLIDSPRVVTLRENHKDKIEEDVSEKLWSVLGTAVHHMFEQYESDNHVVEERVFHEVDGLKMSGAIDLQKIDEDGKVLIYDYKCTSVWSIIFGKQEWENQLNSYAWLLRHGKGLEVSGLNIIAILRDWKKNDSLSKPDYPKSPIIIHPIHLWTKEHQDRYMSDKIAIHIQARQDYADGKELIECTDEERWARPTTYACKKKTVKRAVKVFDSAEDANKFAEKNGLIVEERLGVSTRCEQNYCQVADFCSQFQNKKVDIFEEIQDEFDL